MAAAKSFLFPVFIVDERAGLSRRVRRTPACSGSSSPAALTRPAEFIALYLPCTVFQSATRRFVMIAIKMCPIDGTSILPTMAGQQSSIPGVDSGLMRKDVKDMP